MCEIDGDRAELWRDTPRVARKQHACDGCGATIVAGAHYLEHFDVFEGSTTSERVCFGCWAAYQQFADAHHFWFSPGRIIEQLRDCIGENNDEDDVWRPVLASVLRRYRVSPERRRAIGGRLL